MNILELEVDGFGVWNNLRLDGLSDQLTVLYGRNEAGKSTLLAFVRAMLYGFGNHGQRYLPPVRGGRGGGSLLLGSRSGRFRVRRHAEGPDALGAGRLQIQTSEGALQHDRLLDSLLGNVDRGVFNNVFAVGLREVQELGSLSDSGAAQLLYSLSTGMDRVSLMDVLRELVASRERLLPRDDKPGQLAQLLGRRDQLRQDVDALRSAGHRYAELARQRQELEQEIARREAGAAELDRSVRAVEAAVNIRETWLDRAKLGEELEALANLLPLPEGAIEALVEANARLADHRQHAIRLKKEYAATRRQAAGLGINPALDRHVSRVEALLEQETWLTALEQQVQHLQAEVSTLEGQVIGQQTRFGLARPNRPGGVKLDPRGLGSLKGPARAMREPRLRMKDAEAAAARARESVETISAEVRSALAARQDKELGPALERAGALVTQLRRRVQLDERLAQMARHELELQTQSQYLLERQLLPAWVLVGLGGLFMFGVLLILTGLLLPTSFVGNTGWALAVLGVMGAASAACAKYMLERAADHQLAACQKQSSLLGLQIKQAKDEREGLDSLLPRGGGPMLARLQAAEQDLVSLEGLLSLDARRQAAQQEAEAARERAAKAQEDGRAARRRWRQALAAAGLPTQLSPKQVRQFAGQTKHVDEAAQRLERLREDLLNRQRELETLIARVSQLLSDVEIKPRSNRTSERLAQLRMALEEHQALALRRENLRKEAQEHRHAHEQHIKGIRHWTKRRAEVLADAEAEDEQDLEQRKAHWERREILSVKHAALSREVAAALGGKLTEEELSAWLEDSSAGTLESRWEELSARYQSAQQQLQTLFEKRGSWTQELKTLVEDRRLPSKLLELSEVEEQLRQAVDRWQVLAATHHVLEGIRRVYEADRQPESLQEASGYLARLTDGHYTRVWTPLGDNVLCVDDAEGHSLPVESLSRGTREQLFLALRLALVNSYARRGIELPLVLDDVLVNFDDRRAKLAALVLRDFAAMGRQLLVFTCHEHLWKMFKNLKVATLRLPHNATQEPATLVYEAAPAAEKPAGKPDRPAKPSRPAAEEKPSAPAARFKPEPAAEMIQVVEDDEEEQVAPAPTRRRRRAATERLDLYEEQTEEPVEALPQVTVVRACNYGTPFSDTTWYEPVDDEEASKVQPYGRGAAQTEKLLANPASAVIAEDDEFTARYDGAHDDVEDDVEDAFDDQEEMDADDGDIEAA